MSDFVLRSDRATRFSENFDYRNTAGSTFYYGDNEGVSASSNIGSITSGNVLSRRAPCYAISAGLTYVEQRQPSVVPVATVSAPPAGGTGATAGAYDSAANRDLMIASLNALITDVAALRTYITTKR